MPATSLSPGTAHLKFERVGSTSVLTRSVATSPVKVFATRGRSDACWVYGATLGGGLLGGDEIHITADVGDRARALIATQASTKVYRSLRPARQTLDGSVGTGALLAVLPDPVVCFAEANFTQTQRYVLEADGSVLLIDWMTSGRHATGERWAFSRYESRTTIWRDSRCVFNDAVLLESDLDAVTERMGRFDVLLTAVLSGPLVRTAADELRESIARHPILRGADMIVAASRIADGGTLLRMAGVSVEQVGRRVREAFTFLCPLLGDDPWSRKW